MELYPYQQHVSDLLAAGHNVILQAPTGSGKTRAALDFFLYQLGSTTPQNATFPRRCIYSVPMRVLAKQFYVEYEKILRRYNKRFAIDAVVKTQTGEQPDDPQFTANLTFATIDQTLSSYLLAPYSLSHRKANLNAGAVMSSYLVFDEFHLYDPDSTLPTTLHMLKMFKGVTPFILMTATFSQHMLDALAQLLDATVVPANLDERAEFANLASQQKKRFYHIADNPAEPLSATTVLDRHTGRSLVICNTVDRARRLHEQLISYAPTDTGVTLLHSRFLGEDRNRIEDDIRAQFRKDNHEGSYIVVATQAIEVGVDITSTVLHTELAPANAIIQRAGRCARYPNETGHVYIYQHTLDPDDASASVDLCEHPAPYKSEKDLFALTLAAFREHAGNRPLKFEQEQAIITAVHGQKDKEVIEKVKSNSYNYSRDITSLLRGEKRSDWRHFIRIMEQQQVTIHPNPHELLERPYEVPSFGLHPGTLQGYIKLWLERWNETDNDIPWAVKWLKEDTDPDAEQFNKTLYSWKEIRHSPDEAMGAKLVVVHPRLATYHRKLGFIPNEGGTEYMKLPAQEADAENETAPRYRLETYADHIRLVYKAFQKEQWEMEYAARKLETQFKWEAGSVMKAAKLAILLHDVGKLSTGWQGWVQEYQRKIGEAVTSGEAYAHTELQHDTHRQIERSMKKRPWHAVEGALSVKPMLKDAFPESPILRKAIYSAIARHHAPHSSNNEAYVLTKEATQHIAETLKTHGYGHLNIILNASGRTDEDLRANNVINLSDDPQDAEIACFLIYLLIVRSLRRANSSGTATGALGV